MKKPVGLLTTEQQLTAALARITELESNNRELTLLLDMTTSHSDVVTEELQQDKDDLELMVETTVSHADMLEEELQEKADEALRESERRFRLIVKATPIPILISRQSDNRIVYVNQLAPTLFNTSNTAILDQSISSCFKDSIEEKRVLRQLEKHGSVDHEKIEITTIDGESRWVDLSLRTVSYEDQPCILSALNDITDLVNFNIAASRFVPSEWLEFLDKETIADLSLGDHFSRTMSVMFSDIRSFTDMSEDMSPRENFEFVNEYLRRVSPLITSNSGMIVKFLGDGIMSVFPHTPEDGINSGIATLREVQQYNQFRESRSLKEIEVGIGLNTGPMMVGMVGYDKRIQGDAFSDAVNLTSRIESLTKVYGVSFLITDETRANLSTPDSYDIRFVDRVRVKGKRQSLDLFEVFSADSPLQLDLKRETAEIYQSAVDSYYHGEYKIAQSCLFSVLQKNPADKVAWHHLLRATRALEEGASDGWETTVMTEK